MPRRLRHRRRAVRKRVLPSGAHPVTER
jgi:hypothetical protein